MDAVLNHNDPNKFREDLPLRVMGQYKKQEVLQDRFPFVLVAPEEATALDPEAASK